MTDGASSRHGASSHGAASPDGAVALDANASRPAHPAAWEAYAQATQALNDASPADRHQVARDILTAARVDIAQAQGIDPEELIFTSGGTEAAAWAVAGAMHAHKTGHLVTSALEHPAVARTAELLAQNPLYTWTQVPANRTGRMDPDAIQAACRPNETRLVSLMTASNETGVLQPVEALAHWCRKQNILFHTDAVQAIARTDTPWRKWKVDLASWAGHKIGAVGAIGALYVRRGVILQPPWLPWNAEATRVQALEDPEISPPSAAALAAALKQRSPQTEAILQARRDRFELSLRARLPDIEIIGAGAPRLPHTSCVRFPGCEADGLMMALDLKGFYVSTGSACSSGSIEPSPTLLGMGFNAKEATETLRFSLDERVSDADLDRLADLLALLVPQARSPRTAS